MPLTSIPFDAPDFPRSTPHLRYTDGAFHAPEYFGLPANQAATLEARFPGSRDSAFYGLCRMMNQTPIRLDGLPGTWYDATLWGMVVVNHRGLWPLLRWSCFVPDNHLINLPVDYAFCRVRTYLRFLGDYSYPNGFSNPPPPSPTPSKSVTDFVASFKQTVDRLTEEDSWACEEAETALRLLSASTSSTPTSPTLTLPGPPPVQFDDQFLYGSRGSVDALFRNFPNLRSRVWNFTEVGSEEANP